MTTTSDAIREPLAKWLLPRLDGAAEIAVSDFDRPTGGFSAETLVIPIRIRRGENWDEESVVLRMENPEPAVYPAQTSRFDVEIEIQFRTMQAIQQASNVPIAPLLGYEADEDILGVPFFVMGFVPGEVPRETPSIPRRDSSSTRHPINAAV